MTLLSLADCCRQLNIDPKTLRRWLASAPAWVQSQPPDAGKGLSEEQVRWLAQAHHRSLPGLPQEPVQPAAAPSTEPRVLSDDLREVFVALRALPAQLAALQQQVADLTQEISHVAAPATTASSRAGATSKATNRRAGSRGRTMRG